MQSPRFEVVFLEEAMSFLQNLDEKARDKIIYNVSKSRFLNDKELFKKLTDDVWEFRTLYKGVHYRLFAFWDKSTNLDTCVISTHGIIKKTNKTPIFELEKTERIRRIYFENKLR